MNAQDQRDDDAHHEHLLLIAARHGELRHDQHEDEEVVDRQAVLGEPAGDELSGVLAAGEDPHEPGEDQRERDVEHHPQRRLLGRRDVRPLEDQQQVGGEDEHEHDERADLEPKGQYEVHQGLSGGDDNVSKVSPPPRPRAMLVVRRCAPGDAATAPVMTDAQERDTPSRGFESNPSRGALGSWMPHPARHARRSPRVTGVAETGADARDSTPLPSPSGGTGRSAGER